MSRIRTIKPEILDDDVTAHLSNGAWRLFVSSWVLADDYGNLRANPRQIRGQAFWAQDDTSIEEWFVELDRSGLFEFYTVHGQQYAHIKGWYHQKVDKPGKPHVPGPEMAESKGLKQAISTTCDVSSRESREGLAKVPESLATDLLPQTQTTTSDPDHDRMSSSKNGTALVPTTARQITSTPDLEQAAADWGWQIQLSQTDVLRLRELLDDRPIDETEVAFARAQADRRPRNRRLSYFLGTVKGQRDDAKNGVGPPAASRALTRSVSRQDQAIEEAMRFTEQFNARR